MKRLLAFISVFSVVLVIGYLQPVFFPTENVKQSSEKTERVSTHKAVPYEEIRATGYANYIGKEATRFIEAFGEPLEKQATGLNYELWLYGNRDSDYLEVNVQNNHVAAIKAFNDSKEMTPFSIGMRLADVSEQMTIFSNFTFSYNEEDYSIELMEEDMNYRPLVAFDNQTFAILFFNHSDGELTAVAYLTKEMLLTLMPYQLVEGEALPILANVQQSTFDPIKSNQAIRVMNLLRVKETLPAYTVSTESQKNAQILFSALEKNQKNSLSADRIEAWANSQEQMTAQHAFTLSNDEFQKLVKNNQMDKKATTGMFTEPVYDSTVTILSWFSDSLYSSRFAHTDAEEIGIAFAKESMLVLLQEREGEISQTEDSE